jgi:hypothetical protein
MASDQAVEFANFLGALRARFSNPDLDLDLPKDGRGCVVGHLPL